MKKYLIILNIAIVTSMLSLAACGEEELTPEEQVTQLLVGGEGAAAKTWKLQSVDVDGVDQTTIYSGLTIQFKDGQFTTTNGGAIWPSSGTWTFTAGDAKTIKRDDGVEIEVIVTETKLTLTMTWSKTTLGPGRTSSVSGKHKFELGNL